jgi:hypothetical protein
LAVVICDLIFDFMSTDVDNDIESGRRIMSGYQADFNLEGGSVVLEGARTMSMGWSFVKLFLSLEFAQKLYENNSYEIDNSDGRSRSYKFLSWLNEMLKKQGCNAQLKYAEEMKNFARFSDYSSNIITVFSEENK